MVKLGAVGLVACGLTAATSLAMSRWSDPIDAAARAGSDGPVGVFELTRMSPVIFDTRGVAPVGFAALAFVLGAAIGALVRRTVPAMALTLAVFVAVQVAVPLWVRPHLIPPKQATVTITAGNLHGLQMTGNGSTLRRHLLVDVTRPGAWALANHTVDAAGRVVEAPAYVEDCLPIALGGPAPANPTRADLTERRLAAARADACIARLAQEGYRQQVTFQPADRYWALQWREAGVYLVAASLLAGFCFWRVRRLG